VSPSNDRFQYCCFRTGVQFSARDDNVCLDEKESCLDRLTRNFQLCFPETFRMRISRLNISSWRPLIAMYVSPRRIYSRPESPELELLVIGTRSLPPAICPLSPTQISSLRSGISC